MIFYLDLPKDHKEAMHEKEEQNNNVMGSSSQVLIRREALYNVIWRMSSFTLLYFVYLVILRDISCHYILGFFYRDQGMGKWM